MARLDERETTYKAGDRIEVVSSAAILFIPKGDREEKIEEGAKIDVYLDGDLLFTLEEDDSVSEWIFKEYDPAFSFLKTYSGSYCYSDYLDSTAEDIASWTEDTISLLFYMSDLGDGSIDSDDLEYLRDLTRELSWEKALERLASLAANETYDTDICLSVTYLNAEKLPDIVKINERVEKALDPKTRTYSTLQDLISYEIEPGLDVSSEYYVEDIANAVAANVDKGYCVVANEDDFWEAVQAARL